jgi:fructose-1,6-bisphosphatase/inositol monophosphatase family enzyme
MLPVVPQDIDGPTTFLAVPSQCHILFDVDVKRLRSLGSLAAHLAYVARGSAVGALTQHASLWDIAAMMPILESVGIKGQYLSGEELRLSDLVDRPSMKPLVFAHSRIIDDICKRISLK